jgi:hypothetical protein
MGKKVVFTFGRYNPPTTGHAELIRYAVNLAHKTGAEHRIYTSQSYDSAKNPLPPRQKMAFLRQIFPGVNFVADPSMRSAFIICKKLVDEGYDDVTFVVGDDRLAEFRTSLSKYVKPKTAKDFNPKIHYPFKKFQVVSSGSRKKGISGTDLRAAVRKGDFATFAKASAAKDKTLAREIFAATRSQLKEEYLTEGMSRKDFDKKLHDFIDYTCKYLKIKDKPSLRYKEPSDQGEQPSFAAYSPCDKEVIIMTKNRHPMDIFRSVAHELVHHKQNEDGRLGKDIAKEGSTGSDIENEANSEAGKVMRYFARENPFYFDMNYVLEHKAILLGGVPGSGKDKILKEAILPLDYVEVSQENFSYKDCTGDNLVINGTMSGYDQTKQIKDILENHGYQTMMVFVNTSNEVSKQRNEARSLKGGRVLTETVRFNKWKNAQDVLEKYDDLFEQVIEVKNDLDLNQPFDVIQKTHNKLIECVTDDVRSFTLSKADYNFENMLEGYTDFSKNNRQNPVGGAGNWGTQKLTDRYAKDTPGQSPGPFKPMKVVEFNKVPSNAKEAPMPKLPIGVDRIGPEVGYPKEPTFGDNQTLPFNSVNDPIGRWMVKEETRRRFKEKYGKLAEQKIRETALKLQQRESLDDPYSSFTGATPNAWEMEYNRPIGANQIDAEKQGLFGIKLRRKLKKTK